MATLRTVHSTVHHAVPYGTVLVYPSRSSLSMSQQTTAMTASSSPKIKLLHCFLLFLGIKGALSSGLHSNLVASKTARRLNLFSSVAKSPLPISSKFDNENVANTVSKNDNSVENPINNKAWPPFPFNLLTRRSPNQNMKAAQGVIAAKPTPTASNYMSGAQLFYRYFLTKAKVGLRQFQTVASSASNHLPPAAPPLILLALLPVNKRIPGAAAAATTTLTPEVNLLQQFAKRMALGSLGISAISWAHCELRKNKRLAPLPLNVQFTDEWATVLPPFLPEKKSPPVLESITSKRESVPTEQLLSVAQQQSTNTTLASQHALRLFLKWQRQIQSDLIKAPQTFASTCQEWKGMRQGRRYEREEKKRIEIMEELVAFQSLKKKIPMGHDGQVGVGGVESLPLGWALVSFLLTGRTTTFDQLCPHIFLPATSVPHVH